MASEIVDSVQVLHELTNRFYAEHYTRLIAIREALAGCSNADRADVGFFLKKIVKLCDDMRKETNVISDLGIKMLCIRWVQDSLNTGELSVKGELARATPSVSNAYSTPNKGTPEWKEFMRDIGVDGDALGWDLVRPYWPSVVEYVNHELANGRKQPKGMKPNMYPVYKARFFGLKKTEKGE